jgi:hypothetical protein
MSRDTPYRSQPPRAFWRNAVAGRNPLEIDDLWNPKFPIGQGDAIVTAGSCFAQHIGRALTAQGLMWLDAEPAPAGLTAAEREARHYGLFSFRTGNIYTAAMLRQWLGWALGAIPLPEEAWNEDGRVFDPFRPAVEPVGFDSVDAMLRSRRATLDAIRAAVTSARVFVFTLGLTEAWLNRADGTVYPVCPGTVRGRYDERLHRFHNFTQAEICRDLTAAIAAMRAVNPGLKLLLTVSPVPLTATATSNHALVATTYSKSVLRAAAGQLAMEDDDIDYFPSYEIVTGFPFRGVFFAANLRSVAPAGVDFVMRRFLAAIASGAAPAARLSDLPARLIPDGDRFCEDSMLDYYNER